MLESGDSLVVYSDGVVECRNPEAEEFALDHLMAALPPARQQPAQGAPHDATSRRTGICPMRDDMSLTLIHDEANELVGHA